VTPVCPFSDLRIASHLLHTYFYHMKKVASIAFVGIYFLLSVGVNVLVHTCGGYRTVDVMPASATDPCGCSEEMSDDMCCTLELKAFLLDEDQKALDKVSVSPLDFATVVYPVAMEVPDGEISTTHVPVDTSPPHHVSTTILNCSFLI
jgi:hypothetical protein